jgi:F-type H+-transporting ATPase subunit beta
VFNVSYLNHSTLQSNLLVLKGVLVDIKDTIKGFNMIIDGELDHLPESAFNKGTIEEAIEAGEKMLAEA